MGILVAPVVWQNYSPGEPGRRPARREENYASEIRLRQCVMGGVDGAVLLNSRAGSRAGAAFCSAQGAERRHGSNRSSNRRSQVVFTGEFINVTPGCDRAIVA